VQQLGQSPARERGLTIHFPASLSYMYLPRSACREGQYAHKVRVGTGKVYISLSRTQGVSISMARCIVSVEAGDQQEDKIAASFQLVPPLSDDSAPHDWCNCTEIKVGVGHSNLCCVCQVFERECFKYWGSLPGKRVNNTTTNIPELVKLCIHSMHRVAGCLEGE
jgi:hypothetical protein